MVEMNANFKRKATVIDYEMAEPCYAQFALRHGEFDMKGQLTDVKFRTAMQLRRKTIDFVRKYGDELYACLTGAEFRYLISVWPKIQSTCEKTSGVFSPRQVFKKDDKFEIAIESFRMNGKWYPKIFFRGDKEPGMTVSTVEIMKNSKEELNEVYDRWLMYHKCDPKELPTPLEIQVGQGNAKSNSSTPTDVFATPTTTPATPVVAKKKQPLPVVEVSDDENDTDGYECEDPLSDEELDKDLEASAKKFWSKRKLEDSLNTLKKVVAAKKVKN